MANFGNSSELGDNYELNASSEENEALFVIVQSGSLIMNPLIMNICLL